jgi:hypothetical protein
MTNNSQHCIYCQTGLYFDLFSGWEEEPLLYFDGSRLVWLACFIGEWQERPAKKGVVFVV